MNENDIRIKGNILIKKMWIEYGYRVKELEKFWKKGKVQAVCLRIWNVRRT